MPVALGGLYTWLPGRGWTQRMRIVLEEGVGMPTGQKKRLGLSTQVLLGLVLGVLAASYCDRSLPALLPPTRG